LKHFLALFAALTLLLLPHAATAGGFNIYEMGGRATALGGAFTATADDPSAIFYNPAGMAWLDEGFSVSGNLALIKPSSKFLRAEGATAGMYPGDAESETADNIFTPIGIYATYRSDADWSAGLGLFTPFGLGVEWDKPETFPGRTLSTNAQIEGFYISPMFAYQPSPKVAISAGVNFVISTVLLEKMSTQQFGGDAATYNVMAFKMEGTSNLGISPSAAIMIKPCPKLSFGINYKGGLTNSFEDQDATLTQIESGIGPVDDAVTAQLDALGTDHKASGDLNYPSFVAIGGRAQVNPKLALMLDFVWFNWSVFEEIHLRFSAPELNTNLEEKYQDGQQWRFAGEYQASPDLRLMAGIIRDLNPQPIGSVSPLLPDADRWDYSVGATYSTDKLDFTLGYMLVDFEERNTVENGVGGNFDGFDGNYYDSIAHIPTIGITYNFSSGNGPATN